MEPKLAKKMSMDDIFKILNSNKNETMKKGRMPIFD